MSKEYERNDFIELIWDHLVHTIIYCNDSHVFVDVINKISKVAPEVFGYKEEDSGRLPLFWAITNFRSTEECRLLISNMSTEAINNTVDFQGYTMLNSAALHARDDVCKLLIDRMSTQAITTVNNFGMTALDFATGHGMSEVCELIKSRILTEGGENEKEKRQG